MHRVRHAFAVALVVAAPLFVSACASIWGFNDAVELRDAGGANVAVDRSDGTTCVPLAPESWQGPLVIFEGKGSPPPGLPACPEGYRERPVYDGNATPNAPDATCGCTCEAPTDVTCSPPRMNFFTESTCTNSCAPKDQPITTCAMVDLTGCAGTHFTISQPLPSGGKCAPKRAKPQVSAWSWTANVRVCAPTGTTLAACTDTTVATPTTSLPFEPANYCIARTGEAQCPETYPAARTYFGALTDTRGCSECSCETPTGATCSGGTVTIADNKSGNCTGGEKTFTLPVGCTNGAKAGAVSTPSTAAGGSCVAVGGKPTGAATPATPTTICCLH